MLFHVLHNRSLYACGNKEVLLFQTELFSCIVVVIGIKDLYNGFSQVFLFHSLLVVSSVKGIQAEGIDCLGIPDP